MRFLIPGFLILLGTAAIAGCSSTSPSAVEQARLDAAMQRWAATGHPDYQLQLHWSHGECLPEWTHILRIRVHGGQVTEVFDLTAGAPIEKNERTLTVPELFAYGYPVSVAVDYSASFVDDERGFEVGSVELLP